MFAHIFSVLLFLYQLMALLLFLLLPGRSAGAVLAVFTAAAAPALPTSSSALVPAASSVVLGKRQVGVCFLLVYRHCFVLCLV